MLRLLTGTFTTAAFDRSSFRQFGASSNKATPKDLPSSFAQHGTQRAFLTQRAHRPPLVALRPHVAARPPMSGASLVGDEGGRVRTRNAHPVRLRRDYGL